MKNLKNYIIIGLLASLFLMPINYHLFNIQESTKNNDNEYGFLNSAGSWVLAPFTINPYGIGDYTWLEANATDWCSGAGTELDPWVIENVTIDAVAGLSNCLDIGQSSDHFIVKNCTFINSHYGLYLWSTNNGIVEDCTFSNNTIALYLSACQNNTIQYNYFYNNTGGYTRIYGLNNNINNTVRYNRYIHRLTSSLATGFAIQGISNKLINNTVDNFFFGVNLDYANQTLIKDNTFIDGWRGISSGQHSFNATVINNTISGTSVFGISEYGNGSIYYNNILFDNANNGQDYGHFNRWDNGVIGNYWDDYGGEDLDDNGIGDSPHGITGDAGSEDRYPIWDDGLEPIYIDGSATGVGAKNWTWAESQPWCTGTGTFLNPYKIEDLTLDGRGNGFCISIQNSEVYFEIINCNLMNAGFTFPDAAILLNNVGNGTISGCDLTKTNYISVYMSNCEYNNIINNNATDANLGLLMQYSNFNFISANTINDNIQNAINVDDESNNNTITGNTVINANSYGISIFSNSNSNTVSGNYVESNNVGISMLDHCDFNKIYENDVVDNNIGISIHNFNSSYNLVYNNSLRLNNENGEDDSYYVNYWNLGTLGNYWDDYGGIDANDDGIGDSVHIVSGIRGRFDAFPIWDDGDDTNPTITLNSPSPGSIFGVDAPTFNVNIYDLNLNQSWYIINSTGSKFFFTPTNGVNIIDIDENAWNTLLQGSLDIDFFVNDTAGNEGTLNVDINKDLAPQISLVGPLGGSIFEADAPIFNITLFDVNFDQAWYTISSGTVKYFFNPLNGLNHISINQTAWTSLLEGNVVISFFINDTGGNINSLQVTIEKDLPPSTTPPTIPLGDSFLFYMTLGIITSLITFRIKTRKKTN